MSLVAQKLRALISLEMRESLFKVESRTKKSDNLDTKCIKCHFYLKKILIKTFNHGTNTNLH